MLESYLEKCNEIQKIKLSNIYDWINQNYPELHLEMKWNQPMFVLENTFIIGFSVAKKHISVAPEKIVLNNNMKNINAHYESTKMLFKILDDQDVEYSLLKDIIDDSITLKRGCNKFWY